MKITVPARFAIRTGCAVADQVDHLADQHLEVLVRLVAEGLAHRHQPADVAVVVGAEHDHAQVEAALALVEVVGAVAGDVGRVAVGPDEHPVLVVAELLGAQPQRAVGLVGVAHLGEPGDRPLDRAAVVQRLLVEVDVEVDTEAVQSLLDLARTSGRRRRAGRPPAPRRRAARARRGWPRRPGPRSRRRSRRRTRPRVRRCPRATASSDAREPVDLRTVVVEVVLPRHVGAERREDPGQAVADRGPTRAADVDRTGRVGRDELEVDPRAGVVRSTRRTTSRPRRSLRATSPWAAASTVMLMNPGPAMSTAAIAVRGLELGREQLGELARRHTGLLGQLQRDVGGVVPVLLVLRTLDLDLAR